MLPTGASSFPSHPASPRLARLYGLNIANHGAGECIAIIELNEFDAAATPCGGYDDAELATYFAGLGMPVAPTVFSIGVDGGVNNPHTVAGAAIDDETMMDVEIAGSIEDSVNNPSVISISYCGSEMYWMPGEMMAIDALFVDATQLRISVCVASGDYGSSGDSYFDGSLYADFPTTSPHALACGGTKVEATDLVITSETVWNSWGMASGGGISSWFARPAWQARRKRGVRVPAGKRRVVPDVAANADFDTGYRLRWVDGNTTYAGGGTSAAAPLFAALLAIGNAVMVGLGRPKLGLVHPLIYGPFGTGLFFDVIHGNNDIEGLGVYSAKPGWDYCTGLGAPRLAAYLAKLNTL